MLFPVPKREWKQDRNTENLLTLLSSCLHLLYETGYVTTASSEVWWVKLLLTNAWQTPWPPNMDVNQHLLTLDSKQERFAFNNHTLRLPAKIQVSWVSLQNEANRNRPCWGNSETPFCPLAAWLELSSSCKTITVVISLEVFYFLPQNCLDVHVH